MNDIKIYITTSDFSMHIIPVFQYFMSKYWKTKPEVVFLGFSKPDIEFNDGFSFHSLAEEQIGGAKNWSTYLLDFFNSIDDEFFIFACDDHFIIRDVDREVFDAAKVLISSNDNIGRVDLTPSIQLADNRENSLQFYKSINDINFIKLDQESPPGNFIYKITGAWSIWRRNYFIKNIEPGISPQQWELEFGRRAEGDGFEIIGSNDRWAIRKIEGLSGSQFPGKVNLAYVSYEDVEFIIKNKLIDDNFNAKYVRREYGKHKDNLVFGGFKKYNLKK